MDFQDYFPVWNRLTAAQQNRLLTGLTSRKVKKGTILHNGSADCTGLLLIKTGQLRAYILSDEGPGNYDLPPVRPGHVPVLRLLYSKFHTVRDYDHSEKDTEFWLIPSELYKNLLTESAPLANYTNELMAARFSDVMWLIEQVLWKSLDKRLAAFLLEEAAIEDSNELKITHEIIANHLGSHREVITRMLRYFQSEGIVKLSRGKITLLNPERLEALASS